MCACPTPGAVCRQEPALSLPPEGCGLFVPGDLQLVRQLLNRPGGLSLARLVFTRWFDQ